MLLPFAAGRRCKAQTLAHPFSPLARDQRVFAIPLLSQGVRVAAHPDCSLITADLHFQDSNQAPCRSAQCRATTAAAPFDPLHGVPPKCHPGAA